MTFFQLFFSRILHLWMFETFQENDEIFFIPCKFPYTEITRLRTLTTHARSVRPLCFFDLGEKGLNTAQMLL
ncbi:hypothetical protein Y032_1072g3539 [Ancylostoma ceylanicum]|uniref:Uncharacterized protein n=1 Tax=Ancylostoma ceylanicum TaxID=53326 RepID=A0A016W6Y3_9BILA|nr:hypothetical protein Y032_1072g3539 [Ancylostoma ceylanicum]